LLLLLSHIKNRSIKESIYSNRDIPKSWKTILGYQNEVYKAIDQDPNFAYYLGATNNKDNKVTKKIHEDYQDIGSDQNIIHVKIDNKKEVDHNQTHEIIHSNERHKINESQNQKEKENENNTGEI